VREDALEEAAKVVDRWKQCRVDDRDAHGALRLAEIGDEIRSLKEKGKMKPNVWKCLACGVEFMRSDGFTEIDRLNKEIELLRTALEKIRDFPETWSLGMTAEEGRIVKEIAKEALEEKV